MIFCEEDCNEEDWGETMDFDFDMLFQKSELIPVIVQNVDSRDVLMLGFTNREAMERTLETKTAWFWSRSRKKL